MSTISSKTRFAVAQRAQFRCEYCRIHEDDMFIAFEIDHYVARKHGGGDELDNLVYSCPHCNQYKGTDLTTFVADYNNIVPLFNPRKHIWFEHFEADRGGITPLTSIGEGTVKLLRLNDVDFMILRKILSELGRWP